MIREVVVVGHPGVLGMELIGACDIFSFANELAAEAGRPPAYRVTVASKGGGTLTLGGGLELAGTADLASLRRPIDTLLIVGGRCAHEAAEDDAFVRVVRRRAARSRRVGRCARAPSSWPRPACSRAAAPRPTGCSEICWRSATPASRSTPTRSSPTRTACGRRPA